MAASRESSLPVGSRYQLRSVRQSRRQRISRSRLSPWSGVCRRRPRLGSRCWPVVSTGCPCRRERLTRPRWTSDAALCSSCGRAPSWPAARRRTPDPPPRRPPAWGRLRSPVLTSSGPVPATIGTRPRTRSGRLASVHLRHAAPIDGGAAGVSAAAGGRQSERCSSPAGTAVHTARSCPGGSL